MKLAGFFTDNHKIVIANTTTEGAAATTDVTSAAVDTAGYNGCCFIVPFGAIVSGAVTSIKAQQCDTSGGSYADLLSTSVTVGDTDDDKCFYLDIKNPQEQFLKCVVDRGTQNATVGSVIAVLYGPQSVSGSGITQGTNVSGERHNAPAEGTA